MKLFRRPSKSVSSSSAKPPPAVRPAQKELLQDDTHDIFCLFEHERLRTELGWSYRNLEAGDPKRYTAAKGAWQSEVFEDPVEHLPKGWRFKGKWQVDRNVPGADGDWTYAYDFRVLHKADETNSPVPPGEHFVRRKKWIRQIVCCMDDDEEEDVFMRDDVSMISDMDTSSIMNSSPFSNGVANGNAKYEYSDDEDEDEGRGRSSTLSTAPVFASGKSPSSSKSGGLLGSFSSVIRCPELTNIGKQMKALEASCRKQDEAKKEEWKKSIAPGYKEQIKELEKRIDALKKRLVVEAGMGIGSEHLNILEDELKTHTKVYENFKRQLYFPTSTVALGENGVYFALDDFFLEHASGQFILDLVPGRQNPQVIILLTGTAVGDESGVSIRLKVGKFKLKGDKGKGVPSLSFDTIKVTTVVRVTAMLTFDMEKRKWVCGGENFSIDMLYFRGPFGIRQSLVNTVLSLTTPLIRSAILDALPPEVGVFVAHLPSPLSVRGEFTISGTELNNFTTKMHKSPEMCALVGYSSGQMMVFMAIQKSIERSSSDLIKTMEDLLNYRKLGLTYHREWDEIKSLWNEAIHIYFEKANITAFPPLSFEQLLMGTDEILKNPLSIQFALHSCECQVSLRSVLENVIDFFVRWRSQKEGKDDMIHVVKKLKNTLILMGSLLGLISQNLDFADLKLALKLMAGPEGVLQVNCKDIMAQVPLAIMMNMPPEIGVGFAAPVPHLFFVRSEESGEISVEMLHLGSNSMKSRTAYCDWKLRQQGVPEEERSEGTDRVAPEEREESRSSEGGGISHSLMKAFGDVAMEDLESTRSSHEVETDDRSDKKDTVDTESEVTSSPQNESSEGPGETVNSKDDSAGKGGLMQSYKKRMSMMPFKKNNDANTTNNTTDNSGGQGSDSKKPSRRMTLSFKKKPKETESGDVLGSLSSSPPIPQKLKPKRRFSTAAGRALQLSRQPTAPRRHDPEGLHSTPPSAGRGRSDSSDHSSVASSQTRDTSNIQDNYFNKVAGDGQSQMSLASESLEFVTESERERRSLAHTLQSRPPADGCHRLLLARVQSPHISVVVDQLLRLKPGAELLNVKLGPVEKDWTPFGFEDSTPLHASRETPNEARKQTLVNTNPATARFLWHGDDVTDGEVVNVYESQSADKKKEKKPSGPKILGCPMILQTSDNIKALAQVPSVNIDVHVATALRFISNFFDDIDLLRRFLGVMDIHLQEEIDEYIFLVKVLVDRLGKYLLLPNLELDVNISAKIVATDEDIILSIQPNVPIASPEKATLSAMGNSAKDFSSSSGSDNVIQLFAKINVMDVVADYMAVANAMKRCADFYEQNHGDTESEDDS